MTVRKFLGKEGRTTIPYPIRMKLGWKKGDIITFSDLPDGSVLVTREFTCDGCEEVPTEALDELTDQEQREALIYLISKWAVIQAGASRR